MTEVSSSYFHFLYDSSFLQQSRFKLLKDFLSAVVLVTKDPKLTSIQKKLQENTVKWNFSSSNNNTATKSIRSIVSSVITEQQVRTIRHLALCRITISSFCQDSLEGLWSC